MAKNERKYPKGYWMGVGMSIGVAIGVAMGPLFDKRFPVTNHAQAKGVWMNFLAHEGRPPCGRTSAAVE